MRGNDSEGMRLRERERRMTYGYALVTVVGYFCIVVVCKFGETMLK